MGIAFFFPKSGVAQKAADRYRIGLELGPGFPKNLGLTFSLRACEHTMMELSGHYSNYQKLVGPALFNGDKVTRFERVKTDTINPTTGFVLGTSPWAVIGEKQPLPPVGGFEPGSTLQFRLCIRFVFPQKIRRLSLFVEPGGTVALFRYFTITDFAEPIIEDRSSHYYQAAFVNYRIETTQQLVAQTRRMRQKSKLLYGISYDFGLDWRLSPRLFMTGKMALGLNVNEAYFLGQPRPASHYWWRPSLTIGSVL